MMTHMIWAISREDLTILTFHVPSLAKGQGLCDIDDILRKDKKT